MLLMSNEKDYYMMIYKLDQSKHNSFVMAQIVTYDVENTNYIQPIIKVDN